ncbi:hypothetical protein KFL_003170100 [Klebsormidium nitens]|uniref:Flagellar associated protein n=1 Tax=Klebsormidium nitens TaxID=105231 RepID=A0A1Y1ICP4_KLENI|nr:hypothetical protein KFL_003170100 [Klebsormidium nitens]|eukprot:GAQ86871.1 hypothetical protein KFL_003170100 [Klebsormidium nitens]
MDSPERARSVTPSREHNYSPTRPRSTSPIPAQRSRLKSTFGAQPVSTRVNAPTFVFGSSDRAAAAKVFIDSDHSKTSVGLNSPGPVYEVKSSLGRQLESNKESPTYVSFGSAKRFGKAREPRTAGDVPGPGQYQGSSSIGPQVDSRLRSPESVGFGSSTRDNQAKVFMGPDFSKSFFGQDSPGPSSYSAMSSIGSQPLSDHKSPPGWKFGTAGRFKYEFVERAAKTPGAGQYNSIGSVGKQPQTQKQNVPAFSFGSSQRDQRAKMFISTEHEKSQYGTCSPGPASNNPKSSLGFQINSRARNASAVGFGKAKRLVYMPTDTPGPGQYDT